VTELTKFTACVGAGFNFGIWQGNGFAGLWMFVVALIVCEFIPVRKP
jgi:hypothetical protein